MILRHRKEQKKATTKEVPNVATTTEITANDKDWHIRTSLVEKLRGDIIKGLKSSHIYYLEPGMEDKGLKLSRGEEYELFLPFVKKGYFVYHEERRIHLSSIMQYRVTKHRDSETNALEITEEVLTKNAQL
uniref:Uncharacterized protein n=1 Tax=virus sp. ctDJ83 TaxID=2827625 RepID=A0A8S5RK49_9VIRU|nr:MAG TPA: hypothetical protein [virus sp. ctDJ83]